MGRPKKETEPAPTDTYVSQGDTEPSKTSRSDLLIKKLAEKAKLIKENCTFRPEGVVTAETEIGRASGRERVL
jgi:hypothetical protein